MNKFLYSYFETMVNFSVTAIEAREFSRSGERKTEVDVSVEIEVPLPPSRPPVTAAPIRTLWTPKSHLTVHVDVFNDSSRRIRGVLHSGNL